MIQPQLPEDRWTRRRAIRAAGALSSPAPEQGRDTRLGQYLSVLTELLDPFAELVTRLVVQADATFRPAGRGCSASEVERAEQPAASQHLHALLSTLDDAATHAAEAAVTMDPPDRR